MMNVTGTNAHVTGTRNSRNPHHNRNVTGVTGVTGLCARVRDAIHAHAFAHINKYSPRVHARNTRNTRYIHCATTVSAVTGTRNTPMCTRNTKKKSPMSCQMPEVISNYCIDLAGTAKIASAWHGASVPGRPYLMAEILASAFGVDVESKDGQRLSPSVGRFLSELGMINKRMRGHSGNRHYWIKA